MGRKGRITSHLTSWRGKYIGKLHQIESVPRNHNFLNCCSNLIFSAISLCCWCWLYEQHVIILPGISVTPFSSPVLANSLPPLSWLWFDILNFSSFWFIEGFWLGFSFEGEGEESSVYKQIIQPISPSRFQLLQSYTAALCKLILPLLCLNALYFQPL